MNVRYYVVTDGNLRRIAMKVLEEKLALPQLAGTRQKTIEAVYEWRGNRLFLRASGHYLNFDAKGIAHVTDNDLRNVMELVSASGEIERERLDSPNVASIDLRRRAKEAKGEQQWTPSQKEVDAITADLMGSARPAGTSAIPVLKTVKV